jgi:hypothetical protein
MTLNDITLLAKYLLLSFFFNLVVLKVNQTRVIVDMVECASNK